jgi:hypothetical protein
MSTYRYISHSSTPLDDDEQVREMIDRDVEAGHCHSYCDQ